MIYRALRSGWAGEDAWILRTAERYWGVPEDRRRIVGFRVIIIRRKP